MKAAIIGAGAIGGWMAGALADAGWEVSLLARGATLANLKAHGLRVRRGTDERIYKLPASDRPEDLPRPDYLVIAVKGQSIPEIAPAVAALCGKDTHVVPAVNGIPWWFFQVPGVALSGTRLETVDPGGLVSRDIDVARVIGCVVHVSAWTPEPGLAAVNHADRLIFGEPDGRTTERCAAFAAAFEGGEVKPVVSTRIRRDTWSKLWGNMSMNPLSVLTRSGTAAMAADPDVRGLIVAMMGEMQRLGTKIGLPLSMTPEDRMAVTRKLGDFKTSMLYDAEAGRPLEIGPLIGAVAEVAEKLGEPVPFIRAVLGLVRLYASSRAAGIGT